MADTLLEVIEQNTGGVERTFTLDTSRDFSYRMPREIMKFILTNLLQGNRARPRNAQSALSGKITLFTGAAHNEVTLTLEDSHQELRLEDNNALRTIRSALWAFGGELLVSTNEKPGETSITVHLPKTA
jgi:two-component system, probable response regulator PhcQ